MPEMRPEHHIAGVRRSHRRLLETVAMLDDATARQPSLLPGWDVAMVVTHLARNADGMVEVAEGARVGESRRRYPDVQARDEGIEAGRGRSAAAVAGDLRAAIERLEAAWDSLPTEAWAVMGASATGEPEPMSDLPLYRWRECEIHHADMGLGFDIEDWDQEFVDSELDRWLARLDERLPPGTGAAVTATDTGASWRAGADEVTTQVDAPSRSLLAWLTGRRTEGFPELGPWPW